jgi:hypothetical protein
MYLLGNRRRLVGGLATAVVALAGSVTAVATPAQATPGGFTRQAVTSAHDFGAAKSAEASCPDGEQVHSAGGKINGGAGGVDLKAIVPNAALTSVTVEGVARIGHTGSWSVTAFAVCFNSGLMGTDPVRVGSGAVTGSTATATCPGEKHLLGVGFDLLSSLSFVDEVVPGEYRTDVTVRATGSGIVVGVKAYGICANWDGIGPLEATTVFDDTSPKVAETPDRYDQALFIVGARVNGGRGNVRLDALVPPSEHRTARASAAVVPAGPLSRLGIDGEENDEWSTTVYGSFDWY